MAYMTTLEILSTMVFRNVLFEDSKKKYMKVIIPLSIILMVVNKYILSYMPNVAMISIVCILTLVIWKLTGDDLAYITLQIVGTTMIMFLAELVALSSATALTDLISINFEVAAVSIVLVIWTFMAIILEKLRTNGFLDLIYKIQNNVVALNILVNSMLVFVLFKTLFDNNLLTGKLAIEICFYIILFIVLSFNLFINIINELNEKNKLKVDNNFRPILDEYIHKLRANEHEYKNHLNAIYSIIQVSDEKKIKDNINKYIGSIKENNCLSELLYVENTILKAILYSKISLAEEKGIKVKYNIMSNLDGIPLDDMDLVVVLSNLLNNAIEGVENLHNPWINVFISEVDGINKKEYRISVNNSVSDINKIEISNMTNKGTTTKGENRGYGLYNIKKILKKIDGNILIGIEEESITIDIVI